MLLRPTTYPPPVPGVLVQYTNWKLDEVHSLKKCFSDSGPNTTGEKTFLENSLIQKESKTARFFRVWTEKKARKSRVHPPKNPGSFWLSAVKKPKIRKTLLQDPGSCGGIFGSCVEVFGSCGGVFVFWPPFLKNPRLFWSVSAGFGRCYTKWSKRASAVFSWKPIFQNDLIQNSQKEQRTSFFRYWCTVQVVWCKMIGKVRACTQRGDFNDFSRINEWFANYWSSF